MQLMIEKMIDINIDARQKVDSPLADLTHDFMRDFAIPWTERVMRELNAATPGSTDDQLRVLQATERMMILMCSTLVVIIAKREGQQKVATVMLDNIRDGVAGYLAKYHKRLATKETGSSDANVPPGTA